MASYYRPELYKGVHGFADWSAIHAEALEHEAKVQLLEERHLANASKLKHAITVGTFQAVGAAVRLQNAASRKS
jgi:hypothetical protein